MYFEAPNTIILRLQDPQTYNLSISSYILIIILSSICIGINLSKEKGFIHLVKLWPIK